MSKDIKKENVKVVKKSKTDLVMEKYIKNNMDKYLTNEQVEEKIVELANSGKFTELKQFAVAYRRSALAHKILENGKLKSVTKDMILEDMIK